MCQVTSTTPKRGPYRRNKKAQTPPRGDCGSCKKSSIGLPNAVAADYRLCSRCRTITYCSKACAAAHWAVHKVDCSEDKLQRKDLYSRTKANKRRGEKNNSPRAESARSSKVNTPVRVSPGSPPKPTSPTATNLRWARGPDAPNAVGFAFRRTTVEPVEAELILDELWVKQEARGKRRQARDKKQAARNKRQEARNKRQEARENRRQVSDAEVKQDELVTPPSETRTLVYENSEDGLITPPSEILTLASETSETDGLFTPPSEITSGITSECDELVTPELSSNDSEPEPLSMHMLDPVPMDETALKVSMDETALRVSKPFRLDAPEFVPSMPQAPSPMMMAPPPPGSFIQWQMVVPVYVVPVPKRMRGKRRY